MKTLTFWQYFKLNKDTTLYCLKICSILFAGIATIIAAIIKIDKGSDENPLIVFIACELFGYAFASFIFLIAIFEGYTKAKIIIDRYNRIPARVKENYCLELIKRPLNPKYWFMQFQIVQTRNGDFFELDKHLDNEIKNNWL